VFALLVVFDLVAIMAGFAPRAFNGLAGPRYFQIVLESLSNRDCLADGCSRLSLFDRSSCRASYFGLTVRRASTEIPIAASRAVVAAIVESFSARHSSWFWPEP